MPERTLYLDEQPDGIAFQGQMESSCVLGHLHSLSRNHLFVPPSWPARREAETRGEGQAAAEEVRPTGGTHPAWMRRFEHDGVTGWVTQLNLRVAAGTVWTIVRGRIGHNA